MKHVKGEAVSDTPTIHRLPAKHEGAFVNAYLVEEALDLNMASRRPRHPLCGCRRKPS